MSRFAVLPALIAAIFVLPIGCSKNKGDAAAPPTNDRPIEPVGQSDSSAEATKSSELAPVDGNEPGQYSTVSARPHSGSMNSSSSSPTPDYNSPSAGTSAAPPTDPAPGAVRMHVVQRGETLWTISKRYYGNGREWRKIYAANRNRIKNPSDVPVGIKLIIP